jgi:hypothetical protein
MIISKLFISRRVSMIRKRGQHIPWIWSAILGIVPLIILSACSGSQNWEAADQFLISDTQSPEYLSPEPTASESLPQSESGNLLDIAKVQPSDETSEVATPPQFEGESDASDAGYLPPKVDTGFPLPDENDSLIELSEPPPPKTSLMASDPSLVNLASGNPQLVEFFAFW